MCIFARWFFVVAVAKPLAAPPRRTTPISFHFSTHLCGSRALCVCFVAAKRSAPPPPQTPQLCLIAIALCCCCCCSLVASPRVSRQNTCPCLAQSLCALLLALIAPLSFWFTNSSQRPQQPPSPAPDGRQRRNTNTIEFTKRPIYCCRRPHSCTC